ncbi:MULTISPECIES: hypothetical protein [unclassified Streptomyces]|uniref:hypothetical protein n=1 Tax=unclassified Streptomyces TaxID=2593676 RepID=UPI002E2F1AE4|nr:hypothetical protein [Streptomyces sp. NBC_01268]
MAAAREGRPVRVWQVRQLHADGDRAERTARRFLLSARLMAAAAVLLGHLAVLLLWLDPAPPGQRWALGVGAAALGCGAAWVTVLARAGRWLRAGVIADAGSGPPPATALLPDALGGPPDWLGDWARLLHLVSMCVPLGALTAALASAPGDAGMIKLAAWGATGFALLLTGIMGGIVGGLAFGLVDTDEECWTVRGALRRLRRYAVPFLLAAPWLAGWTSGWSALLVGGALLWLLIAPVNYVGMQIPGTSSSD